MYEKDGGRLKGSFAGSEERSGAARPHAFGQTGWRYPQKHIP
jgi:hypothetical protein